MTRNRIILGTVIFAIVYLGIGLWFRQRRVVPAAPDQLAATVLFWPGDFVRDFLLFGR